MLLIRRFEEKAGQLYGMGLIGGFCHLYIGQEAVVVGMQMAMQRGRPGHHRLSRPRPHAGLRHGPQGRHGRADRARAAAIPRARAARCTCSAARRTSTAATASSAPRCRSAPASPSPTSIARTATSASPISATARPTRARSTRASTWPRCGSCRCVYVIENNRYAMGTSVARVERADRSLQARRLVQHPGRAGRRHGRAGGARRPATGRSPGAATGNGPYILEMKTYRYRGHSMSDPAKYRTREEVREGARTSAIRSSMRARASSPRSWRPRTN